MISAFYRFKGAEEVHGRIEERSDTVQHGKSYQEQPISAREAANVRVGFLEIEARRAVEVRGRQPHQPSEEPQDYEMAASV